MIALVVALGALVGAPARYLIDRAVQTRHGSRFPFGTLTVNLTASLILGLAIGATTHLSTTAEALIGTGLAGTLSTYSTFAYETMRLTARGSRAVAVTNVAVSIVAGLGVAALGWWLATSLG